MRYKNSNQKEQKLAEILNRYHNEDIGLLVAINEIYEVFGYK